MFDCLRKIKAQLLIEKRIPTEEESIIINYLTQLSKKEYKKAHDELLTYNNKPVRIGVYAIIQKGNKSLLVKTKSKNSEIYNFPGGGVENEERFEEALIRECYEEIGCSIIIGEYYTSGLYQNPDYPENLMLNIYYKATLNEPIQDGVWIENCQELPMLSIDKEIFNQVQSNTIDMQK